MKWRVRIFITLTVEYEYAPRKALSQQDNLTLSKTVQMKKHSINEIIEIFMDWLMQKGHQMKWLIIIAFNFLLSIFKLLPLT